MGEMSISAFKHGETFEFVDSPDTLKVWHWHWRRDDRRVLGGVDNLDAKTTSNVVSDSDLDSFGIIIGKVVDGNEGLTTSVSEFRSNAGDDSVHGV